MYMSNPGGHHRTAPPPHDSNEYESVEVCDLQLGSEKAPFIHEGDESLHITIKL